MNDRVERLQLDTSIRGCETPIDGSWFVFRSVSHATFRLPEILGMDISIQALAAKNAQLDLSHIEPTTMLGCEVKLQSVQDTAALVGSKVSYKAEGVWVFKLSSTKTHRSHWEILMNQLIDADGPICFGALIGDFDMAPILQRCKKHEQVSRSLSAIFVIIAFWMPFLTGMLWRVSLIN